MLFILLFERYISLKTFRKIASLFITLALLCDSAKTAKGDSEPGDAEVFSSTFEMSRLMAKEIQFSKDLHAYKRELEVKKESLI